MSGSKTYTAHLSTPHLPSDSGRTYSDLLVEEHPLSLFIHGQPYATFMRTPGADQDLIKGFLWTEGIIEDDDDLRFIHPCPLSPLDRINVALESGVQLPARSRNRIITSSCGLCSLDEFSLSSSTHPTCSTPNSTRLCKSPLLLTQAHLNHLYTELNEQLRLFKQTGGAHGALLFDQNLKIHAVREDVGRHNALDQVLGVLLSKKKQNSTCQWGVILSSRAGFELIDKALRTQLSALVCLGAASGLAHRVATFHHLPLYSFVRPSRGHFHGERDPQSDQDGFALD